MQGEMPGASLPVLLNFGTESKESDNSQFKLDFLECIFVKIKQWDVFYLTAHQLG